MEDFGDEDGDHDSDDNNTDNLEFDEVDDNGSDDF